MTNFQNWQLIFELTEKFIDAFFAHPLIETLSFGSEGRPSYIPTKIIGSVVLSLLECDESTKDLEENRIKDLLLYFNKQADGKVEIFRKKLENHFDDTIEIARHLAMNPEARAVVVKSAGLILTE